MRSRHLLVLAALAPLGCESTPPPTTANAPPVSAPATVPELGPAKEAGEIVGIVRWKNPGATLSSLASCANVPPQLAEGGARALLELGFGDALRGEVDGKAMAALVALDAPVDGIVVLDPGAKR